MISPVESRLYFYRQNKVADPFAKAYQPYLITAKDITFYNSTVPYSSIAYKKGFTKNHEENEINFFFTGNINRHLNLGLGLNYLTAAGHYMNQDAKLFNGQVFGSYNGSHYSIHGAVSFNNLSNFENGGLKNPEDLSGPLNKEDLPTKLQAMSGFQYITGILNQSFSIGSERERTEKIKFTNDFGEEDTRDTIIVEYQPMLTFSHTFETNNSRRRYVEKNANQNFYSYTYRNQQSTNDSTNMLEINNTISVTFEEAFNHVLRFGATAFVRNECQRFMFPSAPLSTNKWEDGVNNNWIHLSRPAYTQFTDTLYQHTWTNNTFVGGSIYKRLGSWIHYDATGEVCLAGYKLGEFNVNGGISADFRLGKDTMYLSAHAYVQNENPHPYVQFYRSNHFQWMNDFQKTYRFGVSGNVSYPTQWIKPHFTFSFENITRYIYFNTTGIPQQHDGNIQVLSADAQIDITTPWVNLENHVVWQHSSSIHLPLPMITLYHNLYYHGCWFHAMDAQIGADLRYFTSYYAPLLNPAIGQFCEQEITAVGNYPVINIYANFYVHLIHLKFFAQYQHINHLFMKDNINYMAMPAYPMNPDTFRAGLAWHFLR